MQRFLRLAKYKLEERPAFQFSIGDAQLLCEPDGLVGRQFQFSIGDAKLGEYYIQAIHYLRVSILYWRCRHIVAIRRGVRNRVSILYWRCSRESLETFRLPLRSGFNSLLEMHQPYVDVDIVASSVVVSILYWRCSKIKKFEEMFITASVSILYWRCSD